MVNHHDELRLSAIHQRGDAEQNDGMTRRLATVLVVLGAAASAVILVSPALLPDHGADVLIVGVLPVGFYASGALALLLRPAHLVGRGLLLVGLFHLFAVTGALAAKLLQGSAPGAAVAVSLAATVAYVAGFVALLDVLARYPSGHYAWPWVRVLMRAVMVISGLAAVLTVLGSAETPNPLVFDLVPNPMHVPALSPLADARLIVLSALITPLLGLILLVARFRTTSSEDRRQMVWPMAAAAVVVVGILTSGLVERALGPAVQSALFITAGLMFPASFLVGLLRHSEEIERLATVEASRRRLAEATLAERRQIERDLHDGAQQQLIALLAQVELARSDADDREAIGHHLDRIRDAVTETHRELRALSQGIHPAVVTDHGLVEAVTTAVTRMPGGVRLHVDNRLRDARLEETIEATAYMCVLEGLTNAAKHAPGRPVEVTLAVEGAELDVTVADEGDGFDPSSATSGSGLTGLRDRLDAIGGRLVVDTRLGRGTTLTAVLPGTPRA
jgi:signal transduction histidine kinase